ncbi:MFS transporter [Aquimonas sp.]|jgi:PPP family 3-phenylpropionic acid transporter|uniref:MFS transporter n=1 Tax=Aquimonas sp. TaxID=1872588 RepID=UPI0037BE5542
MPTLPYWRLSAVYFSYHAAIGVFTPYFARWMEGLGHGAFAISALFALWYGTRIFGPPLFAHFARGSARPKAWLLGGLWASAVGFLGFFGAEHLWLLMVSMAVFSLFYNAILPQLEAFTLAGLGPLKHNYGRVRLWGSLGFILLAVGYGWLLEHGQAPDLPWVMGAGIVATALITHALPAQRRIESDGPVVHASLLELLKRPGVAPFIAIVMLTQISFGSYYLFFTLQLERHAHTTDVVGQLWGLGVVAEIVLFMYAGSLLRRVSASRTLQIALGITVLRWLAIAVMPQSLALMIVVQAAHAIGFGAFHVACMQRIVELFPESDRIGAQSLMYSLGSGLGGVLGAVIAGSLWNAGGGQWAFAAAALFAAFGLLPAMRRFAGPQAAATTQA